MILGFSDAKITILKQGMACREQGELCQLLGPKVCPNVVRISHNGYEMELLEAPRPRRLDLIHIIRNLLEDHVWGKPTPVLFSGDNGWLRPLIDWSTGSNWLTQGIVHEYPEEPSGGFSRIHGDPTLANLMMRGKEFVIIDPMPRLMYRREIPNRVEVDIGKMFQSAYGWEHHLGESEAPLLQHERLLGYFSADLARKGILWAAIHIARIARRARVKSLPLTEDWAEHASRDLSDLYWSM